MRNCLFFISILSLVLACKSQPPAEQPAENPAAGLEFERIESGNLEKAALLFQLKTINPRPQPAEIEITNWKILINGTELNGDSSLLKLDGQDAVGKRLHAGPSSSVEKNLSLYLDLKNLASVPVLRDNDEYLANLVLDLDYRYGHDVPQKVEVAAGASLPRIREPQFSIISIAIMQAELVNTRFKVSLRVDNPNIFPLALSSFEYKLFGDGNFWADGTEKDVLHIPAQSSSDTNLFLVMNFIGMKRKLLDDIIAMRQVRYRFQGNVDVGTGVAWLPNFNMAFDRSGDSPVMK